MNAFKPRFFFHYNDYPNRVPLQLRINPHESPTIPEPIARLAYEEYSRRMGTDQSFERIHQRGGFGYTEVISLLADLIERERAWAPGVGDIVVKEE